MAEVASGMQLAAEVDGAGPVTVLLHGITESGASFAPLVEALAAQRTVVRLDLRGHGHSPDAEDYDTASMAADVAATLEALDLPAGDPLVIGHSLGGLVAVAYASAFPCRGVINIDQSLDLAGFQAQVQQLAPMLQGDEFHAAIAMVFGSMMGPLDTAEVARLDGLRRPAQPVVLGVWGPLLEHSTDELDAMVAALTADVEVPVLALHGVDPGPDYPAWLARRLPSATVEVWADHGHYPHLVDPDRFLARVASFEPS